jgi:hypothetical protein
MLLFGLPMLFIMPLWIFVPHLIIDRKMGLIEAMKASQPCEPWDLCMLRGTPRYSTHHVYSRGRCLSRVLWLQRRIFIQHRGTRASKRSKAMTPTPKSPKESVVCSP